MNEMSAFLEKFNISVAAFEKTGLRWDELLQVHADYVKYRDELEAPAVFIFNTMMKFPNVHSVRYRIKDPENLVEKIIRKKIENPESQITLDNYKSSVTDLIGLRALHLFKEDWESINDSVLATWRLKETQVANYRKGDDDGQVQNFKVKGCETKEHKYGYRSIHYIIETQPSKAIVFAEIQVRTIFEEAWSEIDHLIRYPYDLENPIFFQFLLIFNRLAGSADEMGSFIKFLQKELIIKDTEHKAKLEEKNRNIEQLQAEIASLNIEGKKGTDVMEKLERLKKDLYLPSSNLGLSAFLAVGKDVALSTALTDFYFRDQKKSIKVKPKKP